MPRETDVPKTQIVLDGKALWVDNLGMSSMDMSLSVAGLPGVKSAYTPLATVSQLAISTHRDKFPVAVLGHIGRKGFTAGARVVAGTLVFSTVYDSAFGDLVYEDTPELRYRVHPDSYPPFDLHITKVNETGQVVYGALLGITILDYGTNESVDNIVPMESYSFMALDFVRFRRMDNSGSGKLHADSTKFMDRTGLGEFLGSVVGGILGAPNLYISTSASKVV